MTESIALETVTETPVLQLTISCGTGYRRCDVYASQLYGAQPGGTIIDDGMSSNLCGEEVLVTVAHRTERTVVLLVEERGWTENYNQVEHRRSTRLVAVELMA